MQEFTRSVVVEDRWESIGVDVRLTCLPGQTLSLNVRRYMPSRHLDSIQTYNNSKTVDVRYSLPIGICGANPEAMAETFATYLDTLVDNHLIEFAAFMQQLRGYDHSSRVWMALSRWFQMWKENVNLLSKMIYKSLTIYRYLKINFHSLSVRSNLSWFRQYWA